MTRCLDLPVTTQGKARQGTRSCQEAATTNQHKNLQEAADLDLETWGWALKFSAAKEVYLKSMEVAAWIGICQPTPAAK